MCVLYLSPDDPHTCIQVILLNAFMHLESLSKNSMKWICAFNLENWHVHVCLGLKINSEEERRNRISDKRKQYIFSLLLLFGFLRYQWLLWENCE